NILASNNTLEDKTLLNNTSEDTLLNNTSGGTPLNNITLSTSGIPSCFEGLEKQWTELNKDGRDLTHIDLLKKNITPLEYLSNFLRRIYQEVGSDEDLLQEEDLSAEEVTEISNCKEFESYITETLTKHLQKRTPSTNNFNPQLLLLV
ncbi:hypothetical protein RclHR1_02230001, partial [Rhizophagus clarus]